MNRAYRRSPRYFFSLLLQDIRFELRHGMYTIYAVVCGMYLLILLSLPAALRETVAPLFVFSDPVVLGFFFMGGMILLERLLIGRLGFNLGPHYHFLFSLIPMLMPLMVGLVVGFILLDERDEDILTAVAVTSVSRSSYLLYKPLLPPFFRRRGAALRHWAFGVRRPRHSRG